MLSNFEGAGAVVTGAGSGIGAALARGLAREGARVIVADVDGAAAESVADALPGAHAATVDVADAGSVADLADEAFRILGHVDVLCNNAGVFQGGLSWERTSQDWTWVLGVNVMGIVHAIPAFVPRMLAQGTDGHIVNTSSVAAFVSGPYSSPYVVSKAASFMLSECLAHDLEAVGSRIGVSVLVPSAFDTGIATTARVRPEHLGVDASPDGASTVEFLAATTAAGLPPAAVVEPVVAAIREGHFVVPTKPSYDDQVRVRFEALRDRRLPRDLIVD